jgi:hypothetical protein
MNKYFPHLALGILALTCGAFLYGSFRTVEQSVGATITDLTRYMTGSTSMAVINANFDNLNTDKLEISDYIGTTTLAARTATTTGTNGIDISGGCFAIDGTCVAGGTGVGTPGGSDTQVQFNDGGSTFGGDAGMTYSKTADRLTVTRASSTGITATNFWGTLTGSASAVANGAVGVAGLASVDFGDFTCNGSACTLDTAIPGQEAVEDYTGAMVTGNTETGITVTYNDGTGKLDFSVTGFLSETSYFATTSLFGDTGGTWDKAKNRLTLTYASSTGVTATNMWTNRINATGLLWFPENGGYVGFGNDDNSGAAGGSIYLSSKQLKISAEYSEMNGISLLADGYINLNAGTHIKLNDRIYASSTLLIDGAITTTGNALIPYKKAACWTFASSTSFGAGTTTLAGLPYGITVTEQNGLVNSGTSIKLKMHDGTNLMDSMTATATRSRIVPAANNTWTAREDMKLSWSNGSGTVYGFNYCIYYTVTPD